MSLQGVRKIGVRRSAKKIGGLLGERKEKYQKAITVAFEKEMLTQNGQNVWKRPGRFVYGDR